MCRPRRKGEAIERRAILQCWCSRSTSSAQMPSDSLVGRPRRRCVGRLDEQVEPAAQRVGGRDARLRVGGMQRALARQRLKWPFGPWRGRQWRRDCGQVERGCARPSVQLIKGGRITQTNVTTLARFENGTAASDHRLIACRLLQLDGRRALVHGPLDHPLPSPL